MTISAAELAHRASSDAEQVMWVDADDQPLGQVPRQQLREQGLIGRGTFVFLFDSQGRLCVHQRTLSKALYPGFWDLAAGGMVGAEESLELAARRELAEELGITDAYVEPLGKVFFDSPQNRLWCYVYRACSDAPLILQPEEVAQARFVDAKQLEQLLQETSVCPDTLRVWHQFGQQLR